MDVVRAAILGIVQGLTEFLPVSSDGHLVVAHRALGWPDEGLAFDAVLHLGTFCAAIVVFRRTWWRLLRGLITRKALEDHRLLGLIFLATLPGAVVGYVGRSFLAGAARGSLVAGGGFLLSAGLLLASESALRRRAPAGADPPVGLRHALAAGFLQVLALLPGVSRSGSTIAGGMVTGLSRERAVEFSFLLAAPITGGAGLYALLESVRGNSASPMALVIGFLLAFLTGVLAARFLLRYVRRHTFAPFAAYLVLAALVAFLVGR